MLSELESVKIEGVKQDEEILKTRIRFGTKGLTIYAQSTKLEEFFRARAAAYIGSDDIEALSQEVYLDKNYNSHFMGYKIDRFYVEGNRNIALNPSDNFSWLVAGDRMNFNFLLARGLGEGISVTVTSPLAKVDFDKWVKGLKDTVKSLCRNFLQEYEVDLVIYEKEGRRG